MRVLSSRFHKQDANRKVGECGPRRSISSNRQSTDQMYIISFKGDLLRNSIDRDVHYKRTGGMKAQKYLRKGCCHSIKCFATNFLVVLTWKRPLNSAALATSTHRGLERVSDGTSTSVVV